MARDEDFEPPEVPFQPKPTSVSVVALSTDFSGDSNFTTMPKVDSDGRRLDSELHRANTQILDNGPRRSAQMAAQQPPRKKGPSVPPPPPTRALKPSSPRPSARPVFDEDLHAAPTMIIDINRMRQRQRRGG